MKKIFYIVALLAISFGCDYSVKSNGNIDDAFAEEPVLHLEGNHGVHLHPSEHNSDSNTVAPVTLNDSSTIQSAAKDSAVAPKH